MGNLRQLRRWSTSSAMQKRSAGTKPSGAVRLPQCSAVKSVPGKRSGAWVSKGTRMPVSATWQGPLPPTPVSSRRCFKPKQHEEAVAWTCFVGPRTLGAVGDEKPQTLECRSAPARPQPKGQGLGQAGASGVALRFIQERLHLAAQGGQISFEDSPSDLIRNVSVAMD